MVKRVLNSCQGIVFGITIGVILWAILIYILVEKLWTRSR